MVTRIGIDGVVGDEGSACISVLDRGFLYGDSVYEVLRTYGGRLFALDDHLERLQHSAQLIGIALPVSLRQLADEITNALAAAHNSDSYVRVIITRGAGPIGLDPALADHPRRVVIVTNLMRLDEQLYRSGVKVCLVPTGRSAGGALPLGAKSGNYLTNLLALRAARQCGAHEALMLDPEGRVAEGSTSNVFAVTEAGVCTPPLEVGILEGITRKKVLGLARSAGLAVKETSLHGEDLYEAREIFLTSTLREVLPVTQVDNRVIGDGKPGPITERLRRAFIELAQSTATQ